MKAPRKGQQAVSPALELECEMRKRLTTAEVRPILDQLAVSFPHDVCSTCECFQGFLVQLSIDADQEADILISPLHAEHGAMHGCLGCDPCPPGDKYASYRRVAQLPAPI